MVHREKEKKERMAPEFHEKFRLKNVVKRKYDDAAAARQCGIPVQFRPHDRGIEKSRRAGAAKLKGVETEVSLRWIPCQSVRTIVHQMTLEIKKKREKTFTTCSSKSL